MTKNARASHEAQTVALAALAVVIVLTLASPFGWDYLIPQIWDSVIDGLGIFGDGFVWLWHNSIKPVPVFLGSLFA